MRMESGRCLSMPLASCLLVSCLLEGAVGIARAAEENSALTVPPPGQMLPQCPKRPNCICTEYPEDDKHYVEPIRLSKALDPLGRAAAVITAMGGQVQTIDGDRLAATFTSRLLRFVDDFTLRVDASTQVLHVRSASRVGYSDLGVNRRRVERFKSGFAGND